MKALIRVTLALAAVVACPLLAGRRRPSFRPRPPRACGRERRCAAQKLGRS